LLKVTNEIRESAEKLLTRHNAGETARQRDKDILEAIADGKRKLIDAGWWRKVHGDVDRAKLEKIAALADPARNSSEHERAVAAAKLVAAKARRPPGMKPLPPPLPGSSSEWTRKRKTKTPSSPQASRRLPDSVADKLKALNERRAAVRAAKRAGLKCRSCGKPLVAQRATARYCNATCRSQAWRAARKS
jgi:hypothetical protein